MIYSPNKVLHGNFKMYEIAKSSTALRLGIDNTPSNEALECAEQVAIHILQPVRDAFGSFSPNSWFRCEELEKAITQKGFRRWCMMRGFSDNDSAAWHEYFSRKSHPKGEAVDFEISGVSNIVLFDWCKENISDYDQLIAEFMKQDDESAGWIHGSYSGIKNRNQILEIK